MLHLLIGNGPLGTCQNLPIISNGNCNCHGIARRSFKIRVILGTMFAKVSYDWSDVLDQLKCAVHQPCLPQVFLETSSRFPSQRNSTKMASPISLGSASPAPSLLRRSPKTDEENAPLDSFNLVYLNIFYQGISSHFPWNVLIAGQSFFRAKLEGLEMARDFLSHFTIIFIIIKYIFLLSPLFLFRKVLELLLLGVLTKFHL